MSDGVRRVLTGFILLALLSGCDTGLWQTLQEHRRSLGDCAKRLETGIRPIAADRADRFRYKVPPAAAGCRGGARAKQMHILPWSDWPQYWATGDSRSLAGQLTPLRNFLTPNERGINGALVDMEYARIELIKFNLFDNDTFEEYVRGRDGIAGPNLTHWRSMRLPSTHPLFAAVGGDGEQLCRGKLIRHRTLSGICNDLRNPRMGSSGQLFGRNLPFEETFPELRRDQIVRNRHGGRIGLLEPDPQVISRRLFSRPVADPLRCNQGLGMAGHSAHGQCEYSAAPHLNVLAAFWIQFMTHDWFSHLAEGRNAPGTLGTGCRSRPGGGNLDLTQIAQLGCRPGDRIGPARFADQNMPGTFRHAGRTYLTRAPKTTRNMVTAWWDASQVYGFDEVSARRVRRDPDDPARLLMISGAATTGPYLPMLTTCPTGTATSGCASAPFNPAWRGQDAVAFPDNWSVGLSFFHNLFAREHNLFVDGFRRTAAASPDADSGLRDPADPRHVIRYRDVGDDDLFEIARLVIAVEIAKIHTLEWTTQLLYNEPMYRAMHANWNGLLGGHPLAANVVRDIVVKHFGSASGAIQANQWYSVLASGSGIVGLGSHRYDDGNRFASLDRRRQDRWDLSNLDQVNGGTNHFGAPFNFPEEFTSVYRLHPLLPDLVDYRNLQDEPDLVRERIPLAAMLRADGTAALRERGLANWALSLGRQRLGTLTLNNHPHFLQNLPLPASAQGSGLIDVAALDILRDRERGIPRYNEFRRQIGLRHLASFDELVGAGTDDDSAAATKSRRLAATLREIYGQHRCNAATIISTAARPAPDQPHVDDCLGHDDGSLVDNVEDLDLMVGWLAESTRPHGFAISETQFQIFVINASRRLFSDRFFTSSLRPEFYSHFGLAWIRDNGPDGRRMEAGDPNGHEQEVSPLKRVLLRAMPELSRELGPVVNAFDPWARRRKEYYSLDWLPRTGAGRDGAFHQP